MDSIVELVIGAILAAGTVKFIAALTQRKARERAAKIARAGEAEVPCRVSWPARYGRKAFTYGKLHISGDAALFGRRSAQRIVIPAGGTLGAAPSWRAGNTMISYRSPEGELIRILASSVDAETISHALARTDESR